MFVSQHKVTTCWLNFGLKSPQFSCLGFTSRGHSHFRRRRSTYLFFLTGNSQTSQVRWKVQEDAQVLTGQLNSFPRFDSWDWSADKDSTVSHGSRSCAALTRGIRTCILPSVRVLWSVLKGLLVMHFFVKQSNRVPWHRGIYDTHFWLVSDSPRSFQAWNKGSDPLS